MKLLRILALLVFPALAAIGAQSADSARRRRLRAASRSHSTSVPAAKTATGSCSAVGIPDESTRAGGLSRNRGAAWPYFRRVGLVVHGGTSPVTITVPVGWRDRVAISWGNTHAVSSLQIASCEAAVSKPWNAYAGGFHLRSRAACVPLDIRVGGRSTSVRFGVGRACGAGR